jgi:hypothetical protein
MLSRRLFLNSPSFSTTYARPFCICMLKKAQIPVIYIRLLNYINIYESGTSAAIINLLYISKIKSTAVTDGRMGPVVCEETLMRLISPISSILSHIHYRVNSIHMEYASKQ